MKNPLVAPSAQTCLERQAKACRPPRHGTALPTVPATLSTII
ncbi:hypothetical protein [Bordetella tumulicola]